MRTGTGLTMAAHWKKTLIALSLVACILALGLFASLTIIT
jgi:hypothetical protein